MHCQNRTKQTRPNETLAPILPAFHSVPLVMWPKPTFGNNDKINVRHPQAHLQYRRSSTMMARSPTNRFGPERHETMRINSALLSALCINLPFIFGLCPNCTFVHPFHHHHCQQAPFQSVPPPFPSLASPARIRSPRLILCCTTTDLAPTSYYNKILLHIHGS